MDMEQLAARPSRRGFIATLAAGAGAVLAGLRGTGEVAAQTNGESCCTGTPCKNGNRCDHGTKQGANGWSWFCTNPNGDRYLCQDCMNSQGDFVCNYWRRR
jgi:hypothetical protein